MITDNELRISSESYTHKDFYQIYPEILDLVNKITERWDPSSSNESDPGVVLLKLLAFIADKNNYNIDKNILECFMPSCTQEDSMRKLCDMMGYNPKYYQSAVAEVSFMWVGDELPTTPTGVDYIKLDRFTEITDDSGEVNYVLTEPVTLSYKGNIVSKPAIEGTLQTVEINNDSVVKLNNIDDNRRLYLPESQIAENGIWIWNVSEAETEPNFWKKVDNLNIQKANQKVWKFGFDSRRRLPYIQFPEDIAGLIENGLTVNYIRTSGENGNIKANTLVKLTKLDKVKLYKALQEEEVSIQDENNTYLVISNKSYTVNGKDVETLDEAYNNFKKTVGTFNTLVTCRDYANAIYNLVNSELDTTNLVSNVQVSDIKDDLNFSNRIVSFDSYGLFYTDIPLKKHSVNVVNSLPSTGEPNVIYYCKGEYYQYDSSITGDVKWYKCTEQEVNTINNFDLYIYPLTNVDNFSKASAYEESFKPSPLTLKIINKLEDYKTLSHIIKQVDLSVGKTRQIYNIKNYYHLNAKISTTYKVTKYEADEILENVYAALWNEFNARKVNYGDELSYDIILKTIEKADSRIKTVSLDEPKIKTNIMYGDGREINILGYDGTINTGSDDEAEKVFYTLISKNVLAGRIPLFNYDKRFTYRLGESPTSSGHHIFGKEYSYPTDSEVIDITTDPHVSDENEASFSITYVDTEVKIPAARLQDEYTLKKNEMVQLIAPNLTTVKDGLYTSYINYFFRAANATGNQGAAIPAHFTQLTNWQYQDHFFIYIDGISDPSGQMYFRTKETGITNEETFNSKKRSLDPNRYIWYVENGKWKHTETYIAGKTYYTTKNISISNWFKLWEKFTNETVPQPLFTLVDPSITNAPGYLVDENHNRFKQCTKFTSNSITLYAQLTQAVKVDYTNHVEGVITAFGDYGLNADTVGQDRVGLVIPENTEYGLCAGDELYINYKDSNDIIHNIKYYREGNKFYKKDDIGNGYGKPETFSGIIKTNFELMDSETQHYSGSGKNYTKTTGYKFGNDIVPGMFSLDGTKQIEIRDFIKTQIKYSPFKCYWKTNKQILRLNRINAITETVGEFEYVLNNNEYFFYTDSLENSLVTLSSGTKLKMYQQTTASYLEFKINAVIDLEDISEKGIGAFSDTKWFTFKFNENYYLDIIENQIISLGEGDIIRLQPQAEGVASLRRNDPSNPGHFVDVTALTNDWAIINGIFTYNGQSLPKYVNIDMEWDIRSTFNLDISSQEGQDILSDDSRYIGNSSKEVIEKITLYTSLWKVLSNTQPYYTTEPNKYELSDLSEVAVRLINFTSQANSYKIKSNYAITETGGIQISTHRYKISSQFKDDVYIYRYRAEDISYKETGGSSYQTLEQISMYDDTYYKISLKDKDQIKVPVFVPQKCFGLLMVYYSPSQDTQTYPTIKVVNSVGTSIKAIAKYSTNYYSESDSDYSLNLTLAKGINIFRIKTLPVSSASTGEYILIDNSIGKDPGSIVLSDLSIVDYEKEELAQTGNITGVNYSLLNIKPVNCKTFVQKYILNPQIDTDQIFYVSNPINKYNEIDIDVMNQYSFFNYNNVCNKFVIPQLDSDFTDIQIAKSSRSVKW